VCADREGPRTATGAEAFSVEAGGAPFETVDLVTFGTDELSKVRAVLAGATGD
jgi:hypothetical protein